MAQKPAQKQSSSALQNARIRILGIFLVLGIVIGLMAAVFYTHHYDAKGAPLQAERIQNDASYLVVETSSGRHELKVEVADTPEDLQKGLMHRETMARNAGMLFDFGLPPRLVTFWMHNTLIPLDMIFIDQNGTVVRVHKNAVPMSQDLIASQLPVQGVLEVNAGVADELGIEPGSKIHHAIFLKKRYL